MSAYVAVLGRVLSKCAAVIALAGAMASLATAAPAGGTFRATGDLTFARNAGAATLLEDGSVVVFGPSFDGDRYSAATGTFVATGSIHAPRFAAHAFALPDGSVLVIGGTTSELRGERYDPATNTWGWSAPMSMARAHAQATQLLDGRILVAGGRTASGAVATAEIYNPATGSFASVPPMPQARADGIAETLLDGHVLIAGGVDAGGYYLKCSVLFDPSTTTFSAGPCLEGVPYGLDLPASARLADGRVLVSGGWTSRLGGSQEVSNDAELYDPQTNRFTAHAMAYKRVGHTATMLPSGAVLVAGGMNDWGIMNPVSELFEPSATAFHAGPVMTTPRYQHTATALPDGSVLIAGGETLSSQSSWTTAAELYVSDEVFACGFEP